MSVLYVDNLQPNLGNAVHAAGHLVQKVHAVNSTTTTFNNGNGWVTALTASITPKFTNSLIYITVDLHHGIRSAGEHQFGHRIYSTASSSYVALTSDNSSTFDIVRKPDDSVGRGHYHSHYVGYEQLNLGSISAITYNFQVASPTSAYPTIYLNFSGAKSVITVEEIAQ